VESLCCFPVQKILSQFRLSQKVQIIMQLRNQILIYILKDLLHNRLNYDASMQKTISSSNRSICVLIFCPFQFLDFLIMEKHSSVLTDHFSANDADYSAFFTNYIPKILVDVLNFSKFVASTELSYSCFVFFGSN